MKPEFRGLRDSLKTLTFTAHAFLRILVVLLLTAFPHPPSWACAPGIRFTCTPFRRHREQSRHGGGAEAEARSHQTTNAGCGLPAAPSLHLGCDIIRLRGAVIGLQATGLYAQPEMLVGVNGKNGARASEKCTWARLRFLRAQFERRSV